MQLSLKNLCFALLTCLVLTGCKSSKTITETGGTSPAAAESSRIVAANAAFIGKMNEQKVSAKAVTAKLKANLAGGGNSISANGSLKMKRGEAVQIAFSKFGIEVIRLEIDPDSVTIINRLEKYYVRTELRNNPLLGKLDIDFHLIESLFWGEFYMPQGLDARACAERVIASESGKAIKLFMNLGSTLSVETLANAEKALPESARLLNAAGQNAAIAFGYEERVPFAGGFFPSKMNLAAQNGKESFTINMELSKITEDANWHSHTQLSGKYKRKKAESLLKLIP